MVLQAQGVSDSFARDACARVPRKVARQIHGCVFHVQVLCYLVSSYGHVV